MNQCFAESVIEALLSLEKALQFLYKICEFDKVANLLLSDSSLQEVTSLVVDEIDFEYDTGKGHDSYEFMVCLLNRFYESAVSLHQENWFIETFVTTHNGILHLFLTVDLIPLLEEHNLGQVIILLIEQPSIPQIKGARFCGAVMFEDSHFYFAQTLHQTLHIPRLAFFERIDRDPR